MTTFVVTAGLLASIAGGAVLLLALIVAVGIAATSRRARAAYADTLRAELAALEARLRNDDERLEREMRQAIDSTASASRLELGARLNELQSAQAMQVTQAIGVQNEQINAYGRLMQQQLGDVSAAVQRNLADLRLTLEQGNDQRLEQIRATVEEKLQTTLETRLGESFRLVSDRLEQVHKGLGEMQSLAAGVGDLKRVLSNVKSRGNFGEVQLAGLLEQVMLPDQYEANVATRPGSSERVDFAVRMPGRGGAGDRALWLPLDAKFPVEDYERLLAAQELADRAAADDCARAIERAVRVQARSIRDKYIEPPHTTDFAILFLPTEGLFAEVLRRPGLVEALNRDERVVIAGPTTLFAMLNALQMGFRTLAIEQRSAEVWQVLGAVKTEFGKFGDVLQAVKRQLQSASNSIDSAETRTRQMARKLRDVEALSAEHAAELLPPVPDEPDG
jgi:DNA recombination protein RmuC